MEILVNCISKSNDFEDNIKRYIKMSSKYAKISQNNIFNDKISKAQSDGVKKARIAYDEAYQPYVSNFNVVLDENGKMLDSLEFAQMIKNCTKVSFFIGGAYGFSDEFKKKAQKLISLSRLTTSHGIAKLMLFEQIFRALCINAGHPYHK
ncbi:23S rRNA (pseudouridine(1915)-N(3))-methyltransferase RlmH [Campylobacter sp. RM12327]|uniref:Ribosomal RNA large subunit methyltransferase H n=1 Tax=Campylobacter sputorum subsp. sputorum TaxID=32024 RepID=A0A381DKC1_9BACT|nr:MULTISPECIES: 23S rRNA (pseudouridine(1915)-N(3))-methyltransferase RlmH [Campylobacter]ASM34285.1 SPOUT methyltransferase [Campylobacter sputorum aubsp. sputorum RM3237]ASM35948.1 SPOUT methyltransferase [Campylobacter sputorum bv. faecalis CCUG 20703]ASM39292.1 SPOUT methyltransferase [Campylobacter sputorum]KAB0582321.1 23S rRNA (pseudouridine(1915)-N(3))-methyltransferase RlmH [Campylobacter sputorum subsp. sputorum]MBE7358461.1 23S rRNA (pseudouridine(1915)-N(3))-methyltransferase RlmH